jgi:hypothetical protein
MIYENSLKDLLSIFAYQAFHNEEFKSSHMALMTAKFTYICFDPFKYFDWAKYQPYVFDIQDYQSIEEKKKSFDLSSFYELYQNMSLNDLLLEVKSDLSVF